MCWWIWGIGRKKGETVGEGVGRSEKGQVSVLFGGCGWRPGWKGTDRHDVCLLVTGKMIERNSADSAAEHLLVDNDDGAAFEISCQEKGNEYRGDDKGQEG